MASDARESPEIIRLREAAAEEMARWEARDRERARQGEARRLREQALEAIEAERERQVQGEGWSLSHDDTHVAGELARAAAAYACPEPSLLDGLWPWEPRSFKPGSRMRDLAKAGALIVAEMERLSRRAGHGE